MASHLGPSFVNVAGGPFVKLSGDTMSGALVISGGTGNRLAIDTQALVVQGNGAGTRVVGVGVAAPVNRLDVAHSGVSVRALNVDHSITTAASLGSTATYNPVKFVSTVTATDAVAATVGVSYGPVSTLVMGAGGVATVGTGQAFTSEVAVRGCGNQNNEYAGMYIGMTGEIGTGFTQTAGPVGRFWGTDFSVHGSVGVRPNALMGVVSFVNNYYNGSPLDGSSACLILETGFGVGGSKTSTHAAATTYPLDCGILISGTSGTANPGATFGYTTGIKIGGASPGRGGATRVGTGIDIADFETYGINISGRKSGATGVAMSVAGQIGGVVIGGTSMLTASSYFEVQREIDSGADPLVQFGSTAFNRGYTLSIRNGSGIGKVGVAGSTDQFLTGTVVGDSVIYNSTGGKKFHIGGSTSVIAVKADNTLSFFNHATAAQQTVTGSRGANAALASLLTALAAYGIVIDSSTV